VDTEATSLSFETPVLPFEISGATFDMGLAVSCFEPNFGMSFFLDI